MTSLLGINESNNDRGMDELMENNLIHSKESDVLCNQDNILNFKNKLRDLKRSLRCLDIINSREINKESLIILSDMKTKMETLIHTTESHALQGYLQIFNGKYSILMLLLRIIIYHVSFTPRLENSKQILNLDPVPVILRKQTMNYFLFFKHYLKMQYKVIPTEMFRNIHTIWKSNPTIELQLKLIYCEWLMNTEEHKTFIQLIHHNVDYFIKSLQVPGFEWAVLTSTTITVILHILHHQVSICKIENVRTIQTILPRILNRYPGFTGISRGFHNYILTLDHSYKHLLCTPLLEKYLQPVMEINPLECLEIILLCINRLKKVNNYTDYIMFMRYHTQLILSLPMDDLINPGDCYHRQQYCRILLLVLDSHVSCNDTCNMNLVLKKLKEFKVSLLSDINICYCSMGNGPCHHTSKDSELGDYTTLYKLIGPSLSEDFLHYFLCIYHNKEPSDKSDTHSHLIRSHTEMLDEFNFLMNQVIHGQFKLAPYLLCLMEMMNMRKHENNSFKHFVKFIERSIDHNADTLYDIIKMVCAFDFQPKMEDKVLQRLTEFLITSYKGQYGLLCKLVLDINIFCPKGQFLQELTSGITKLWVQVEHDTVNNFKQIIYKCYCTVRQANKSHKDTNIEKYKEYFTFLASMEVEEEMKKMKALTNILLMLTLLQIASGGHHKSAELKKYLSLKYEYRESILYLLWCSGDVEINPGPTLSTLRKVPDSVKERNWIYEMCSKLLRLLKYKSIELKNDGLWEDKPLHWPTDCLFYNPRNKPKNSGYNIGTDKKLLECLEELCNVEGVFNETTHFDDEPTKLKVTQYQKEILAWKNNRSELFEQYFLRQVLDTLKAAKGSLHKYRKELEFNPCVFDIYAELIFNSGEDSNGSKKSYTDIVRDIATTFCRIGKGLNYLEKSAGIWKTPPSGWNPCHPYYSPCNDKKDRDTGQDDKLVDNLLTYCESKSITIPIELQPLIVAWKQGKTSEVTKSYTIWSKTAIVKHSLQYLELEGLLGKIHVQESLKQIGLIVDKQHWKCQKITSTDNDDKSQDSGLSNTSHSSPCTVNTTANITNSSPKVFSFPTLNDNQLKKFTNSTNINLNAACDSSYYYDSHENDHVCHTEFNLDNQWNQSSKHTCVSSCKDSCSILTQRAQPEADDKHHPISPVNFSNSKYQLISSEPNLNEQLIPSTVYIYDNTSKPQRKSNNISKTAKKRHRDNNDESCSESKRLHISEEDLPLFLQVLTSSSDNGKDIANTSPKGNSNDCKITAFSTDHLSHDSISMKSRPNLPASGKQTDQLVINKLPDTSDGKPVDLFSYTQADNENKKGETTSDQWVNQIVNLLEEIEQDYSATVVEPSSGQTSSHRSSNGEIDKAVKNIQTTSDLDYNVKEMINLLEELDPVFISNTLETHKLSPYSLPDQSSDYSDELPDHVESIIDELLNSNDTNNTFDLMNGS